MVMSEAGQAAVSSDGEIAAMKVGGLRQRGLLGKRSQDPVTERYSSPDPALGTRTHSVSA